MNEENAEPRAGSAARSSSAQVPLAPSGAADVPSGLAPWAALPPVLDVPTAARMLGIGRTNAYRLAASGGLPFPVLRIGGQWRVPTAGVLAALGIPLTGAGEQPAAAPLTTADRLTWCEFDGSGDV